MNKKLQLSALFLSVLFLACGNDDDNSNNDNEPIVLTENNFIYEGDLQTLFLTHKIDSLDVKIEEYEEILAQEPNDTETQSELDEAIQIKEGYVGSVAELNALAARLPVTPIGPINPCVCIPASQLYDIEYIAFHNTIESATVNIYSGDMLIGSTTTELTPIPQQEFVQKEFNFIDEAMEIDGSITIEVIKGADRYTTSVMTNQ